MSTTDDKQTKPNSGQGTGAATRFGVYRAFGPLGAGVECDRNDDGAAGNRKLPER